MKLLASSEPCVHCLLDSIQNSLSSLLSATSAKLCIVGNFALDASSAPEQPEPPHGRDAAGDAAPADMELPADAGHSPSRQTAVGQGITDSQVSAAAVLRVCTASRQAGHKC
jgi:hypothetical protein